MTTEDIMNKNQLIIEFKVGLLKFLVGTSYVFHSSVFILANLLTYVFGCLGQADAAV